MFNSYNRDAVRRYFYGTKGPLILATLGTMGALIVGGIIDKGRMSSAMGMGPFAAGPSSALNPISYIPGTGILLAVVVLLSALIWHLAVRFGANRTLELAVDECLENDLTSLRERALQKLGIVSEQISLIAPIKVTGPYDGFTPYANRNDAVHNPLVRVLLVILKIYFFWIYLPYLGIKALINQSRYTPRLIFKYGSDDRVRYSMVRAHIFLFSEDQIYVYRISYDICSGEIFEESTYEYFYRDIDCVITGEEHRKILSRKKLVDKTFEYFRIIVTSGTSTSAYADCPVSILDTQVMGMRELIRNKKEEIHV